MLAVGVARAWASGILRCLKWCCCSHLLALSASLVSRLRVLVRVYLSFSASLSRCVCVWFYLYPPQSRQSLGGPWEVLNAVVEAACNAPRDDVMLKAGWQAGTYMCALA